MYAGVMPQNESRGGGSRPSATCRNPKSRRADQNVVLESPNSTKIFHIDSYIDFVCYRSTRIDSDRLWD